MLGDFSWDSIYIFIINRAITNEYIIYIHIHRTDRGPRMVRLLAPSNNIRAYVSKTSSYKKKN